MKYFVYIIVAFLLILSWSITGYVLQHKGINITNTYHQYKYQNQQQAQLMFGLVASTNVGRIKRIFYTIEEIESKGIKGKTKFEKINNFLNTLSPEESFFAIISKSETMVSVPIIEEDVN